MPAAHPHALTAGATGTASGSRPGRVSEIPGCAGLPRLRGSGLRLARRRPTGRVGRPRPPPTAPLTSQADPGRSWSAVRRRRRRTATTAAARTTPADPRPTRRHQPSTRPHAARSWRSARFSRPRNSRGATRLTFSATRSARLAAWPHLFAGHGQRGRRGRCAAPTRSCGLCVLRMSAYCHLTSKLGSSDASVGRRSGLRR